MDCTNYTTERRKGQHLTFEERVIIRTRWNDVWNNSQIAKEIGCTYNCIKKETEKGMTSLYNGNVYRCKTVAEPAVVTMVERKTRMALWLKIPNHTADAKHWLFR